MKTIREHLQDLPEPASSRALQNMWWEDADNRYELQADALAQAFNWSRSPEKYKYWHNIHAALIGNDPLP
jgi:hypothetical protein